MSDYQWDSDEFVLAPAGHRPPPPLEFTATAIGHDTMATNELTSDVGSGRVDPPYVPGLGILENPHPTIDPQGGNGNEAAPMPDIYLKVLDQYRLASDGKYYPRFSLLEVRWELFNGVEKPPKFHVYLDGVLVVVKEVNPISTWWVYSFNFVKPNTSYHWQVRAVNEANVEYLSSPIYHHITPSAELCHKLIQKVAVLPCIMPDTDKPALDPEWLQELVFSGEKSVYQFFKENSFGKFTFTGTVLDPVTLPNPTEHYYDVTDEGNSWKATRVIDDVRHLTVDNPDNNYDTYIVACVGFAANAFQSNRHQVFNGTLISMKDIAHEWGHFLGVNHAYLWKGEPDLVGPSVEKLYEGGYTVGLYGDSISPMGVSERHFTAYDKETFGWIPSHRIQTVTQSGPYELQAVELLTNFSPLQLKIPIEGVNNKIYYSIEFRYPYGFDAVPMSASDADSTGVVLPAGSPLKGVLVRLCHHYKLVPDHDLLGSGTFLPQHIVVEGAPFHDPHRNITISFEQFVGNSGVRIHVDLGD